MVKGINISRFFEITSIGEPVDKTFSMTFMKRAILSIPLTADEGSINLENLSRIGKAVVPKE